ncbi:MAG: serine hydrolase domain-containing protein [Bacteroidota bacterium]
MQLRPFFFYFALLLSLTAYSQATDSMKVAAVVEDYLATKGFSGTILVAQEGHAIYHRSFGLAYRATPDTITNRYHYSIASVTKLFTSIRILQLVEEGKLTLNRPAGNYLPKFTALLDPAITVGDLLRHTSGLPNEPEKTYLKPAHPADLVRQLLEKKKGKSTQQFNYNNVDYLILGLIIEALTGQSWREAISTSILQPLGMDNTGFLEYGYYPANFAYPYQEKNGRLRQDPLFYIENFYAAGCMYSTTTDLLKLDQALYADVLLSTKGRQQLAISFPEYNYVGYGVWNYSYPFVSTQPTVMERRGGILGANVVLVRLTDDNYTIIILSNDDRFNPDSFGDATNLREGLIRSLYSD